MKYKIYGLINIIIGTLILYLLLESLIGSFILSVMVTILSKLSIVKRILGLSEALVRLEDFEKLYLEEIKEEINKELNDRGIHKTNYSLKIIDKGEMVIYSLGDHRIYLDRSLLKLSKRQLKAAIYHELGHICYGDIDYVSSIILGNSIFLLLIEIILIIQGLYLLAILIVFIFYLYINIRLILFNKNNLQREIRADRFAIYMGYSNELLELLLGYKFRHDKKNSNPSRTPSKKYFELKKRILKIEKNEA